MASIRIEECTEVDRLSNVILNCLMQAATAVSAYTRDYGNYAKYAASDEFRAAILYRLGQSDGILSCNLHDKRSITVDTTSGAFEATLTLPDLDANTTKGYAKIVVIDPDGGKKENHSIIIDAEYSSDTHNA